MVNDASMTHPAPNDRWLSANVLLISFSACFADLGYQAVLAVFPLFLVNQLAAPAYMFGIATAISYGPGAAFGLIGGRLGDKFGHKKIALTGNLLIPLLSLAGLATSAAGSIALFAGGWWARNFRSPPRRAMLTEVVLPAHRAKAFGFLHALDIGGGFLAATAALLLLLAHVALWKIFLFTIVPLLCSSLVLSFVRAGRKGAVVPQAAGAKTAAEEHSDRKLYRRLLWATGLYGFSSFSFGFPIITVDQATRSPALAVLSYVVFFGISALAGLATGHLAGRGVRFLAIGGYAIGAIGTAGMGLVGLLHWPHALYYVCVSLMGLALGVIETLEPAILSRIVPKGSTGGGMGALTATRSLGLFAANIVMGVLYQHGPMWSYGYAAVLAFAAAIVMLAAE